MNITQIIISFLNAAQDDPRIKPLHITLFLALCWGGTAETNSKMLTIFRKDMMPLARIASTATYHKYLKELVAFGYVYYQPSYNYYSGSKVSFPGGKIERCFDASQIGRGFNFHLSLKLFGNYRLTILNSSP
jgi:hypothetical protein